jgi:(2Fe-2S) ferredoxin
MKYEKHVFICSNEKDAPKKCCGSAHGTELTDTLKQLLQEKGLTPKIRAQKAGCLDCCGLGPSMVIYPEGVFYGNVQTADLPEILDKHLINNEVVERLRIF